MRINTFLIKYFIKTQFVQRDKNMFPDRSYYYILKIFNS